MTAALDAAMHARNSLPHIDFDTETFAVSKRQRQQDNPKTVKSALMRFFNQCRERDALLGKRSKVTKQLWSSVKEEWRLLPEDERLAIEDSVQHDVGMHFPGKRIWAAQRSDIALTALPITDGGCAHEQAPVASQAVTTCQSQSDSQIHRSVDHL